LQIEPEILAQMTGAGKGQIVVAFGSSVERLDLNLTNPDPALGDKRSTLEAGPHPFNSDPAVMKALSLAIDRSVLVEAGYGESATITCNIVPAPAVYASTTNDWCKVQDIEGANKLLDDAGWKRGADGIRQKDGKKMSILLQTTTNSVRQATQALIKDMWQKIGVETELRNIDGSVFFGGDPASPDTAWKLYADTQMYMDNFAGVDPEQYLAKFTCDNIPGPATNWGGGNIQRYCDPEYDAVVTELSRTASLTERAKLAIRLNDTLIERGGLVPLVYRGIVSAHAATLVGVKANGWDADMWNAADWTRAK
jgi:peptide/nickel transport system substrate-binding protein